MGSIPTFAYLGMREFHASCVKITRMCFAWGAHAPRVQCSAPSPNTRFGRRGADQCSRGGCAPQVKQIQSRISGSADVITTHGDLGKTAGVVCPPEWHLLCFELMLRNLIAAKPKQPIGLDRVQQ
jgi:hypothetical protein